MKSVLSSRQCKPWGLRRTMRCLPSTQSKNSMQRLRAAISILVVIAAGCGTRPQPVPVTDATQRLVLQSFSVLPPRGENWRILERGVDHIFFGKQFREAANRGDSLIAIVETRKVNARFQTPMEFLEFVERSSKEELSHQRYRPLRFKATVDSSLGPTCVQVESAAEDSGVAQFPGSRFLIAAYGFDCLHPHVPGLVVKIAYSTRFPLGVQIPSIEAEVVPFLKSLLLTTAR